MIDRARKIATAATLLGVLWAACSVGDLWNWVQDQLNGDDDDSSDDDGGTDNECPAGQELRTIAIAGSSSVTKCVDTDDSDDSDSDGGTDTEDSDDDGGDPMSNGDISVPQFQKWRYQNQWISYENGAGCTPLYPGLSTGRMIYRCPE
ncbi:MAG: hypothetical protein OXT07_09185 [bacterium]|nr:hypothetical protein [bacterium]